jgi:glycosyltransferase involved in cell wall biosynthesis
MDSRKNVKNLLAGFALSRAKLPNLRLVIIGNRTELIQPLIDSLNLSDRVVLTGFVTDDEKVALLEGAKAMAYPSLYEGLGLPILEAFAVGVPVLTCRNSSLFEVAGDAAIYVEPLSPTSIAEGIVEIFNEGVADRLRSLGHRRLEVHATVVARQQLVNLFATNPSPQVSRRRWRKQFNSNHKTPIDG